MFQDEQGSNLRLLLSAKEFSGPSVKNATLTTVLGLLAKPMCDNVLVRQ